MISIRSSLDNGIVVHTDTNDLSLQLIDKCNRVSNTKIRNIRIIQSVIESLYTLVFTCRSNDGYYVNSHNYET